MFSGKKITIGDKEYTVPGLTAGQLRNGALAKIREHDELLNTGKGFDSFPIRTEIIGIALKRNYPKLTDDQIFDMIDTQNITEIWMAVLGVSGIQGGTASPNADPMTSGPSTES